MTDKKSASDSLNIIKENNKSSDFLKSPSEFKSDKISIDDLTNDEKSLSLAMLKCLVYTYPNDAQLGEEIRKIFNQIKS
jgi:hypothetical protein